MCVKLAVQRCSHCLQLKFRLMYIGSIYDICTIWRLYSFSAFGVTSHVQLLESMDSARHLDCLNPCLTMHMQNKTTIYTYIIRYSYIHSLYIYLFFGSRVRKLILASVAFEVLPKYCLANKQKAKVKIV